MSVIIRLQNLPWSANAHDIREFFVGMSIPEGGVHIVGGELGDSFIAFTSDEDARLAMRKTGTALKGIQVSLLLSSRTEMQTVIETARQQALGLQAYVPQVTAAAAPPPPILTPSAQVSTPPQVAMLQSNPFRQQQQEQTTPFQFMNNQVSPSILNKPTPLNAFPPGILPLPNDGHTNQIYNQSLPNAAINATAKKVDNPVAPAVTNQIPDAFDKNKSPISNLRDNKDRRDKSRDDRRRRSKSRSRSRDRDRRRRHRSRSRDRNTRRRRSRSRDRDRSERERKDRDNRRYPRDRSERISSDGSLPLGIKPAVKSTSVGGIPGLGEIPDNIPKGLSILNSATSRQNEGPIVSTGEWSQKDSNKEPIEIEEVVMEDVSEIPQDKTSPSNARHLAGLSNNARNAHFMTESFKVLPQGGSLSTHNKEKNATLWSQNPIDPRKPAYDSQRHEKDDAKMSWIGGNQENATSRGNWNQGDSNEDWNQSKNSNGPNSNRSEQQRLPNLDPRNENRIPFESSNKNFDNSNQNRDFDSPNRSFNERQRSQPHDNVIDLNMPNNQSGQSANDTNNRRGSRGEEFLRGPPRREDDLRNQLSGINRNHNISRDSHNRDGRTDFPTDFNDSGNFNNHSSSRESFKQGVDSFNEGRETFHQGRESLNNDRDQFERPREQFNRSRDQFDLERELTQQDREPFPRDREPFRNERDQFGSDRKSMNPEREQFNQGRDSFNRDQGQFSRSRDEESFNLDKGSHNHEREQFHRDREHFHEDRDEFHRDKEPLHRDREQFHRGRGEPFHRNRESFNESKDKSFADDSSKEKNILSKDRDSRDSFKEGRDGEESSKGSKEMSKDGRELSKEDQDGYNNDEHYDDNSYDQYYENEHYPPQDQFSSFRPPFSSGRGDFHHGRGGFFRGEFRGGRFGRGGFRGGFMGGHEGEFFEGGYFRGRGRGGYDRGGGRPPRGFRSTSIEILNLGTDITINLVGDHILHERGITCSKGSIKLLGDRQGSRLIGVALIRMNNPDEAFAVTNLSGSYIRDNQIQVNLIDEMVYDRHHHFSSNSGESSSSNHDSEMDSNRKRPDSSCVRVRGIPLEYTEKDVMTLFADFKVDEVVFEYSKDSCQPSGTCYIRLHTPAEAGESVTKLQDKKIEESALQINICPAVHLEMALKEIKKPTDDKTENNTSAESRDPKIVRDHIHRPMSAGGADLLTDCVVIKNASSDVTERSIRDFFSEDGLKPEKIYFNRPDSEGKSDVFVVFPEVEHSKKAKNKTSQLLGTNKVSIALISKPSVMKAMGLPFDPLELFKKGGGKVKADNGSKSVIKASDEPPADFGKQNCVIALGNVSYHADISDIIEFLKDFDLMPENVLRRYDEANRPTADARVSLSNPEAAAEAVKSLHKTYMKGRPIFLSIVN